MFCFVCPAVRLLVKRKQERTSEMAQMTPPPLLAVLFDQEDFILILASPHLRVDPQPASNISKMAAETLDENQQESSVGKTYLFF